MTLVIVSVSSCSVIGNKTKADHVRQYHAAIEQLKKKKYWSAFLTLESLLPVCHMDVSMQAIDFYIGLCLLHCKKYKEAICHLKKFINTYPKHTKMTEALYYQGLCHYYLSLHVELDQADTQHALHIFKHYLKKYRTGKFQTDVAQKIRLLERKKEKKNMKTVVFYKKKGEHTIAQKLYKQFSYQYPQSDLQEKMLFFLYKKTYQQIKKNKNVNQYSALLKDLTYYYTRYQTLFPDQQRQYLLIYYMFDIFYDLSKKKSVKNIISSSSASFLHVFLHDCERKQLIEIFLEKKNNPNIKKGVKELKLIQKITDIIKKTNSYEKKNS